MLTRSLRMALIMFLTLQMALAPVDPRLPTVLLCAVCCVCSCMTWFCTCSWCIMPMWMPMNVPVRPIPALQCTTQGCPRPPLHTLLTPCSMHVTPSVYTHARRDSAADGTTCCQKHEPRVCVLQCGCACITSSKQIIGARNGARTQHPRLRGANDLF